MENLKSHIRDYFTFQDGFLDKFILHPFSILVCLFVIISMATNNPFSKYEYDDPVEYYKSIDPIDVNITEIDESGIPNGEIYYDIKNQEEIYIFGKRGVFYRVSQLNDDSNKGQYNLLIKDINKMYVHPLPYLTRHNESLLFFGTEPSYGSEGTDYLSKIVTNGMNTLSLVFLSLVTFLIFGIFTGIFLGYYHEKMNMKPWLRFGDIFESVMKIFEATPLLLWLLLTVIFIELFLPTLVEHEQQRLTFIFYGIYSSSALSKLIADKIQDLKAEEFITSLRLQGIPNYKIISVHILKCYCMPIICFQAAYNIMQTLFIDITLNVLKFGYIDSWGKLIFNLIDTQLNPDSQKFHLIIMMLIIFSFLYICYTFAKYFEHLSTKN